MVNGPPAEAPGDPEGRPREPGGSISERIRQLFGRAGRDGAQEDGWDISYVVSQSFDAMQGVIARQKLAAHPAEVVIEIPQNACGILDYGTR